LLIFHCFCQFSDSQLHPFYFSADIVFVEHLPVLGFTENTKLYATDKDSSVHNLELSLVGLEEYDATKDGPRHKGQGVQEVGNETGEHLSTVELSNHRQ
jgi:hypothetical protein